MTTEDKVPKTRGLSRLEGHTQRFNSNETRSKHGRVRLPNSSSDEAVAGVWRTHNYEDTLVPFGFFKDHPSFLVPHSNVDSHYCKYESQNCEPYDDILGNFEDLPAPRLQTGRTRL